MRVKRTGKCRVCDRPDLYLGLCSMHYQRFKANGVLHKIQHSWTVEEIKQLTELASQQLNAIEIAKIMKKTPNSIRGLAYRQNIDIVYTPYGELYHAKQRRFGRVK